MHVEVGGEKDHGRLGVRVAHCFVCSAYFDPDQPPKQELGAGHVVITYMIYGAM